MRRLPPRSTRTDTLGPYTTLVRAGEADASQQCLDPREQFARAERLTQVVVGAQLQADDPIGLVGTGGEHDDRHRSQPLRSEEHTSELQSLMRISYAVFCLKKKTITQQAYTKLTNDQMTNIKT